MKQVQWYPGHMTKAKRAMQEDIKLVDLVIEILDARVPVSGRNPDIDELAKNKLRLLILNKADLAEEKATRAWVSYFQSMGYFVTTADARSRGNVSKIQSVIAEVCKEKTERDRKRGILNRPVRAMVVGIPNVGKSTFINSFAGKAAAKTGNKPGVTKGNQWIHLNKQVELLDTPGILWPKFEDEQVGIKLALIGSINDEILDQKELAVELINILTRSYPEALKDRYGIATDNLGSYEILEAIGQVRGCLMKGSEVDTDKAARILMDDFRSGRLGRITLDELIK